MLRKLRTVGISTFLKYYFVFKYYPQAKCVAAFDEEDAAISPESRLTKTNAAQAIFRQDWHVAALQYIRDHARKVDARRNQEAAWLLQLESDACPAARDEPALQITCPISKQEMKKSKRQLKRHIFHFEGGDDLSTMGASWFISYLYHLKIAPEHRNWELLKTKESRLSVFKRTQSESTSTAVNLHRHFVEQVCAMSTRRLSRNSIKISGNRIVEIAKELLSYMSLHQ